MLVQNAPAPRSIGGEWVADVQSVDVERSKFDLTIAFGEVIGEHGESTGINVDVEYPTAMFGSSEIDRLISILQTVMWAVATDPNSEVGAMASRSVALGCDPDVLQDGIGPTANIEDLCDHIAQVALRHGDRVALVHEDKVTTYAELIQTARSVRDNLWTRGVGPGDRVAVLVSRCADTVAALLGVLLAEAAYIPLELTYPESRLQYMLTDSRASVVVIDSPRGEQLAASVQMPSISLAELCLSACLARAKLISIPESVDRAAYVIYTSGSTGQPKGVVVGRNAMSNLVATMASRLGLKPRDRMLALTTLAFDIAVVEIFCPLTVGASIVVIPEGQGKDPAALARTIDSHKPTFIQATPSLWQALLDYADPVLAGVTAISGGEPLTGRLAKALHAAADRVFNAYGPSETTVWSTLAHVDDNGEAEPGIGRPLDNTRVYVLDENLALCPMGSTGELYIAGDGLAQGYFDRPALTASRFIADPFGPTGTRMYRTGDLATWRSDGTLVCLGRSDNQVKLRGFRIELGDIERAIGRLPGVVSCAVVVDQPDSNIPASARLVAFVVLEPGSPTLRDWRNQLKAILPEHMLPVALNCLTTLPLTSNGKVDRLQLRHSIQSPRIVEREDLSPLQEKVVSLVEKVARVKVVSVDDDLFAVGLHSLLMVKLTYELNSAFGISLLLSDVFTHPTAAQLVGLVSEANDARRSDTQIALPRSPSLLRPAQDSPFSVLAFPHAGGSAREYLALDSHLEHLEVAALQFPGRGDRLFDPPLTKVDDMVEVVLRTVRFPRRFALLGHSFGALVALETARRLCAEGMQPALLVVSCAARIFDSSTADTELDSARVAAEVVLAAHPEHGADANMGGTEEASRIANGLAADLEALRTFRSRIGDPLPVPILEITARDEHNDHTASPWSEATSESYESVEVSGNHFYFRDGWSGAARHIADAWIGLTSTRGSL